MSLSTALTWVVVLATAGGVYLLRASFLLTWSQIGDVPDGIEYGLALVPPAVLATFVLPGILAPEGDVSLSTENARLAAGPVAVLVAYRTESILWTIVAGLATVLGWQLLL